MNITVRPAGRDDYAAVEAIMKQVQQLHVDWRPDIYVSIDVVLPEEEFASSVENGTIFVAEADGTVAGVLEIVYRHVRTPHMAKRDVLFVETMAVDEPYRGKGIGRAFFDFLKALRDEKGLDGIELQVNGRNQAAFAMYEHCGFTVKSINMELLDQKGTL